MSAINFPSSIVFPSVDRLKPTLGLGETFRDPALRQIYLELNSNGLGDVINLVPLIQEIAAQRPDVAITVVSSQWKLPFQWSAANVSTAAEQPPAAELKGPHVRYFNLSASVRYHLYAPHWLQFFFITGIGTYTHRGDPFPLMPEQPWPEFSARLAESVGDARGYILLHLENTRREWEGRNTDLENLMVIARELAGRGYRVFEIGNDNPQTGEFLHLGKLRLEELVYAMKHATGFVGIDSFPMHIAALYDKPLLGFFAATHPDVVLPLTTRLTMLRNEAIPCNGCVYITRPRDHNRCTLGALECAHALPEPYLHERLARFLETIDARTDIDMTARANEHWWRMSQLLFEESLLLDDVRGKRFVPHGLRLRIAASISSEIT